MKSKEKLQKVTLLLLFLAIIGLIVGFRYSFEHWFVISNSEQKMTSNLGDEFILQYVTVNFPDLSTDVTVLDSKRKEKIASYVIDGEFVRPTLLTLIDLNRIRCYRIDEVLIFKTDDTNFESIDINRISDYEPKEQPEFVEVAKVLIAKNDWKWIKACGKFLVKAGDQELIRKLKSYSLGQFSEEELEFNKNNQITKEEMKSFAKETLGEK